MNKTSDNGGAWISPDNKILYWHAGYTIYQADITDSGFANAAAVPLVNSVSSPRRPVLTDAQLTMYLSSNQGASAGTTVANMRIWKSTRSSTLASWSIPQLATELSDSSTMYPSDVSPDGCVIYTTKASSTSFHIYQVSKPL